MENNEISFSDKMRLDMIMQLAKIGCEPYREYFKKMYVILNNGTSPKYCWEYINKQIDDYIKSKNYKITTVYDFLINEHEKFKALKYDDNLLKEYFECTKNNNQFEFRTAFAEDGIIYISHRAKENNAWKDFIKNYWYSDKIKLFRIRVYNDIYNAVTELEKLSEKDDLLHSEQKTTTNENK